MVTMSRVSSEHGQLFQVLSFTSFLILCDINNGTLRVATKGFLFIYTVFDSPYGILITIFYLYNLVFILSQLSTDCRTILPKPLGQAWKSQGSNEGAPQTKNTTPRL